MKITIVLALLILFFACNTGNNNYPSTNNYHPDANIGGRNTITLDTGRVDTGTARVSIRRSF